MVFFVASSQQTYSCRDRNLNRLHQFDSLRAPTSHIHVKGVLDINSVAACEVRHRKTVRRFINVKPETISACRFSKNNNCCGCFIIIIFLRNHEINNTK